MSKVIFVNHPVADLDGHVWELLWMDPAVAAGDAHVAEAEVHALAG